jgi:hypothetical protein
MDKKYTEDLDQDLDQDQEPEMSGKGLSASSLLTREVASLEHKPDELDENVQSSLTGNARLEEIYETMNNNDPTLTKLYIKEPLQGELDFGFLGDNSLIDEIVFQPGEKDRMITGLIHLPNKLKRLVCTKNKLRELINLPASLEELIVTDNILGKIDLISTPNLRIFNGSKNKLYILENLPATLEELNVSHNQLNKLNLLGLTKLTKLDCTDNRHPFILENYPTNQKSIDVKMDTDVLAQVGGASEDTDSDEDETKPKRSTSKITYTEALNQYFAFKTKYDESVKQLHKKSKATKETTNTKSKIKSTTKGRLPPCIQCHTNVGMTFSKKGSTYHAYCGIGDKRNCSFEIELFAGDHENLDDLVNSANRDFENEKQELVQQKMETLFGWIDNKTSATKFKERLEAYVQSNLYIDILMNLYRETHSSPSRQELIDRQIHHIAEIKIQIQEVLKEFSADRLNNELLQQAMEIHVKELMPELAKLQKLRNIAQEMNPVYEMVEGFMGQQTNQLTGYKLFQHPSSLGSIEFQHTAPKVVKYVRS